MATFWATSKNLTLNQKLHWLLFGQLWENIGLLFTLTSGHTAQEQNTDHRSIFEVKKIVSLAVVVAQLVEQFLPIPESAVQIQSSAKINIEHLLSAVLKRRK